MWKHGDILKRIDGSDTVDTVEFVENCIAEDWFMGRLLQDSTEGQKAGCLIGCLRRNFELLGTNHDK